MDAVEAEAPGKEARPIQSSGMTNRAKTLPLSPLPFSPEVPRSGFFAGVNSPLSAAGEPPETAVADGRESARFATTFEPVLPARAYNCNAPAGAGRRIAVRVRKVATARLNLKRDRCMRLLSVARLTWRRGIASL